MKNPIRGASKKQRIYTAAALVVALIVAGTLYAVIAHNQKEETKEDTQTGQVAGADSIAFRGSDERANAFIKQAEAGDSEAAGRVYAKEIQSVSKPEEKMVLYREYSTFAAKYKMHDLSLKAAIGANEVSSSYTTLAEIARVYGVMGDIDRQVEYLEQAIARVDDTPDDPNANNIKARYQSMIDTAEASRE